MTTTHRMPAIPVFRRCPERADGRVHAANNTSFTPACWDTESGSPLSFVVIESAGALEEIVRESSSDESTSGLIVFDGISADVVQHTMLSLRQIDSRMTGLLVDAGREMASQLATSSEEAASNTDSRVDNKPLHDAADAVLKLGRGLSVAEIHAWVSYLVQLKQAASRPMRQPDGSRYLTPQIPARSNLQSDLVASQSGQVESKPLPGLAAQRELVRPDSTGAWSVRQAGPPVRRLSVEKSGTELVPAALEARRAERAASSDERSQKMRPVVMENPSACAEYGASDEGRIRGRILIAEDLPSSLRLLTFLLEHAGAEVVGAADGTLAMQAFDESLLDRRPFDLILMDMVMPGIDGYACCELLRKRHYAGPIIAITSRTLPHDRSLCLQAGADDYVSKPVDRNHFMRVVRHWLMRHDETGQLEGGPIESESGAHAATATM